MRFMKQLAGVVVAVAAMAAVVGCGKRTTFEGPDATVALVAAYGTDILRTAEGAVDIVINYVKVSESGQRTPQTDAVVAAIETELVPAAERLSVLLNQYVVLSNTALRDIKAGEIETQLQGIETIVETILQRDVPDELAANLNVTVQRTRALVAAIRAELDKFAAK